MSQCNYCIAFLRSTNLSSKTLTLSFLWSVLNSVGLVPSWISWVSCHRVIVLSWAQNIFSWVLPGPQIFSCMYFVGLKFLDANFLTNILTYTYSAVHINLLLKILIFMFNVNSFLLDRCFIIALFVLFMKITFKNI